MNFVARGPIQHLRCFPPRGYSQFSVINFPPESIVPASSEEVLWYAVYTAANHEKRVSAQLQQRAVPTFLPLYETVRQWSDRRVQIQAPLFPGYLFVHMPLSERVRVLQTPGVVRILGERGRPTPLATDQINALRRGLAETAAQPYPYLTAGRRVRIVAGPLQGLEGILLRRKSGLRVVVSIDLIQRSMVVDVDCDALVPVHRSNARAYGSGA